METDKELKRLAKGLLNERLSDLKKLIQLLPEIRKIKNTQICAKIESIVAEIILSESKTLKEIQELVKEQEKAIRKIKKTRVKK